METINKILAKLRENGAVHPVMGVLLTDRNTLSIDLSTTNPDLKSLNAIDLNALSEYIFGKVGQKNKKFGIGGYLEDRIIYQKSAVFGQQGKFRNIHLGVDVWAQAGQPVFSPLTGVLHSFKNNNSFGDYGPTIILQHETKNLKFHTLYGHLSKGSLKNKRVGDTIQAGKAFAKLGKPEENVGWPPHLHFQIIIDLEGKRGDYPGVCHENEIAHYRANCPDPMLLIK